MSAATPRPNRTTPLAAAVLAALQTAALQAEAADAPPQQMPKISVGADADRDSYKTDELSSPKYTQPLRDTPQTVTVVPESIIREQGATTLRDVLRNSPGITFQAGEGGGGLPGDQNFTMRGFSSRNSIFMDGVRDAGSYTRDSFNLQQVEVIKGPTGTMAGRSATSGMINQVTKRPHAGDTQDYSLGYGSDDYKRVTADVNMSLSDSMALRVNAVYHDADVSNRDVVANKRWGIAPSFALDIGSASRLTLSYLYLDEDNVPDYGLPWLTITQTTASDPSHNGTFPTGAYGAHPHVDQSNFYGLKNYDFEDIESQVATVQLDHDFSDAVTLRNVLRWLDTDRDSAITSPRPPNRQLQRRTMSTSNITNLTDVTFRFATGSLEHALATGLELARETTHNRNSSQTTNQPQIPDFYTPDPDLAALGPMPPNTGNPGETRGDTVGIYATDTVTLTQHWQVVGGLRWDSADIDYISHDYASGAVIDDLSKSESDVNWHAAVIYKPRENGSIYLSYGTSYDPTVDAGTVGAGLSTLPTAANNINLEPEESTNLELGTKWDLLSERLSITAAAFRMEKKNVRTRLLNTDPYVLDGEQVVRGVELGVAGSVTRAWSVFSGFVYLDSEYKHSVNTLDVGQELLLTPDFTFNAWTTYALPFGLTIGAGMQYTDDIVRTRTAALGEVTVPGHWLFDAMASMQVNDSISVRLNATNLADEEYVDRFGGGHYVPGAGRTLSLTANITF
jgi:catecholate siderophore receptor